MVHTNFNLAFTDEYVFDSSNGKITVHTLEVAKLNLPSGNIIACDPGLLYLLQEKPFSQTVNPGSYPVYLSVAENDCWGTVIACAMLKFSQVTPVRWELATLYGQDIRTLAPGEVFVYGVDSGLGCFTDAQAVQLSAEELEQMYFEKLVPALGDECFCDIVLTPPSANSTLVTTPEDRSFWDIIITPFTDADLVAFNSGFGDGRYANYWGFAQQNNPVCLVTDFKVLLENIEAEIIFDNIIEKLETTLQDPQLDEAGLIVRVHQGSPAWNSKFERFDDNGLDDWERSFPSLVVEVIGKRPCYTSLFIGSEELLDSEGAHGRTDSYVRFRRFEGFPEETRLVLRFSKGIRAL